MVPEGLSINSARSVVDAFLTGILKFLSQFSEFDQLKITKENANLWSWENSTKSSHAIKNFSSILKIIFEDLRCIKV